MIILTDDIKKYLLEPENIDWTLMSAVAGDDLCHGVKSLVEQLQAHQSDEKQLTTEQIIETLSELLTKHKESMDSIY